ncbi:mediator of RNA polymerase II transcription subunit 16-like [Vicia villosa]|uniref:mediator of RNA polymerase II transcription subunit 16-like n=1 Tax=Vicia villosa TaxID=3911 RepID=UPI00273BF7C2|nr:mediator of RNA polymerase II transcription subunit 16-like [Vicia villosa]
MVQIGGKKDDRETEEVSNSNSTDSEKKIEEAVTVTVTDPEQEREKEKDSMEMNVEDGNEPDSFSPTPATVFQIRLEQPDAYSLYKMDFPQVCRNFSAVAWCGKLNAIACASEACISDPSSILSPSFWIPVHIVIPERPTESAVFNVIADSPRDPIQFIEWSPACCPRALLIANFHGRVTIWTQPSQGPANFVLDTSCWLCEHEWRQEISVATKWLSAVSPYRRLSSKSSAPANSKSMFEEKFISQQSQTSARWPNFFCVCSVLSSGLVQLHWSQWPPSQNATSPKWFSTRKGQLGCGPRGIVAGDAIITESGIMHVAAVPFVNPSTIVVWEVMPGSGSGFLLTPKTSINNGVPPRSPPNWSGFAPLAAYLFSWQDYLLSEEKKGKNQTNQNLSESIRLYCSPVSNFSAYMSPEAAAKSAATPAWGSGISAVAFDPIHGGSVLAVVIVEGQYMSPFDLDEGPSITGWRVQRWESSLQPVVFHPIFENPTSSIDGKPPMQDVWQCKVDMSIPQTNDIKNHQTPPVGMNANVQKASESGFDKSKGEKVNAFDLPTDIRALSRVVYSAQGGEMAIAFLRGGVHIFSSLNFAPLANYQIDVGAAIAAPAFSATSCCSASVWHDTSKGQTILKIIRVLPPAIPIGQVKANSSTWECEIAERFWWSLLVGIDWWDAVGCAQSAAEDGIVSLNSVIAVLDADFHSLPTAQHRQQYCHSLDRIKCRLLEGSNAQEVRAVVLDMQARLLLDMLGKGIESALNDPSALVPDPWQVSAEALSSIGPKAVAVEPALIPCIQAYVDSVLDLASHFITRLRRYASYCHTLASHGVTVGTGSNRNKVTGPAQNSTAPATSQGGENGTTSSSGSTEMKDLVQGAIAKISNTSGVSNPTPNPPISGPSSFMPISMNGETFSGTPAVRLMGDCHFLHRLCQLLLFCFFFRRSQLPRYMSGAKRTADNNTQKPQPNASVPDKVEEIAKPVSSVGRSDDSQTGRVLLGPRSRGGEEQYLGRLRFGTGNAGQGYTFEEVKVLFLVVMDLCRRTSSLQHPLPVSQVGSSNIQVRLHYIDGNYTVLPDILEASIGPHMQNMPRPRSADAGGLLLRELDLNPPAEEWYRQNSFGGPWTDLDDEDDANDAPRLVSLYPFDSSSLENNDIHYEANGLLPRKRRMIERDAAFGLNTSESLGAYLGIMGSRRDVVTASWKTGLEGVWYKCIRCLRQTSAFASSSSTNLPSQDDLKSWWVSRWAYGCPMCGGRWTRVV